jgi:hypothetical protein
LRLSCGIDHIGSQVASVAIHLCISLIYP